MKKLNIDKPSEILQKAFDDVCTKSKQVGLSIMFIQEWDTPALGFLGVAAAEGRMLTLKKARSSSRT
jgi:hypothetical protein